MRGKLFQASALILIVAGCTAVGTPATTPPSVPTTAATTVVPPTTLPPTTTTTAATTTTVDRIAEIQAIFQDLEERRLQALYEGDTETFKSLFANKEYLQRSLGAFDVVEFDSHLADAESRRGLKCLATRRLHRRSSCWRLLGVLDRRKQRLEVVEVERWRLGHLVRGGGLGVRRTASVLALAVALAGSWWLAAGSWANDCYYDPVRAHHLHPRRPRHPR